MSKAGNARQGATAALSLRSAIVRDFYKASGA
jgi:hypothetical protein